MNRATHVAERQFVTSRLFDVPRELVFKAFTDLDHLKRWWGPKGVGMTFEEFDPQPGGAWRFVMHNPDGLDHRSEHVFIEVVKPERLVLRDVLDREFQLTILITEETQRTRVTWCKSCNMIEECERGTPCAIKANGQQFDRLAAQLAIMAAKRPFVMSRILDAPRDLIWMVWTEPEHLRWWGPKGAEIHHHRYDFRPGGIFHYRMRRAGGQEMWGRWMFREIIPFERLEFLISISDQAAGIARHPRNAGWPMEVLSTVVFTEQEGKTRLTISWLPFDATETERETFDASHEIMRRGWTGTLNRLMEYLASVTGGLR